MADERRSWLDGPEIPSQFDDGSFEIPAYAGEKMGLPETGPGSLASVRRRMGGVAIDWVICWIIAGFVGMFTDRFGSVATMTLLLFIPMGIISCWLFARTPGQATLGMGVARIDQPGTRVGLWRSIVRTVLTVFIFPAAIVDVDGRGMHDRATGTSVIMG